MSVATTTIGTVSAMPMVDTATQGEPTANAAYTVTEKLSLSSPVTEVTVARAGPLIASCSRASATMTAFAAMP